MKDRMRKHQYQSHQKLWKKMRKHMLPRNPELTVPKLARNPDVLTLLKLQHLSSDQPGKGSPMRKGHAHDHTLQSLPIA